MTKPITRVVLLHGYAGGPQKNWFPWLHAALEKRGVAVTAPALPSPLHPRFTDWLKVARQLSRTWDDQTLIVAHSLGGVLAIRALERFAARPVAGVILVAVPFTSLINVKPLVAFFEKPVDWSRVRASARSFAVIQAKNDPLIPYDHALRYVEALGADIRLSAKGGHFDGKTFPALLAAITRHL